MSFVIFFRASYLVCLPVIIPALTGFSYAMCEASKMTNVKLEGN